MRAEQRISKTGRDGQEAKGPLSTTLELREPEGRVLTQAKDAEPETHRSGAETLDPLPQRHTAQAPVRHHSAPTEGAVSSVVCGGRFPAARQM